jgi:hypothetical protein
LPRIEVAILAEEGQGSLKNFGFLGLEDKLDEEGADKREAEEAQNWLGQARQNISKRFFYLMLHFVSTMLFNDECVNEGWEKSMKEVEVFFGSNGALHHCFLDVFVDCLADLVVIVYDLLPFLGVILAGSGLYVKKCVPFLLNFSWLFLFLLVFFCFLIGFCFFLFCIVKYYNRNIRASRLGFPLERAIYADVQI